MRRDIDEVEYTETHVCHPTIFRSILPRSVISAVIPIGLPFVMYVLVYFTILNQKTNDAQYLLTNLSRLTFFKILINTCKSQKPNCKELIFYLINFKIIGQSYFIKIMRSLNNRNYRFALFFSTAKCETILISIVLFCAGKKRKFLSNPKMLRYENFVIIPLRSYSHMSPNTQNDELYKSLSLSKSVTLLEGSGRK